MAFTGRASGNNQKRWRRFERNLRRYYARTDLVAAEAVRSVAASVGYRASRNSPVDTGTLRADWQISQAQEGHPLPKDNYRAPPFRDFVAEVREIPPLSFCYVINPQRYAPVVEFGLYPGDGPKTRGGYSTQAPQGMLSLAVVQVVEDLRSRAVIVPKSGKIANTRWGG